MIANGTHDIVTMASAAGYPLIIVPLGFNQTYNEPFGLLFSGTAWSESILLRIAHGFEQALPIRNTHRPKYAEQHETFLEFFYQIIEYFKKLFLLY